MKPSDIPVGGNSRSGKTGSEGGRMVFELVHEVQLWRDL